jgi:potassium-dependent mechanosensitive channel
MITELIRQLKEVPEYLLALKGAVAVLAMALPIYAGLRYFLFRRRLEISLGMTLNFFGAFILFSGLAFLLASPLASHLPGSVITAYLFLTCVAAAMGAASLIDVFLLRHYLMQVKRIYISPPLRTVIKLGVFCVALLPILRFVLDFNPLALVAIPTIATAGIALALQDTLKAFIAGIGLGHMVRLGEWISYQNKEGRVVHINWARTVIDTADGQRVYIPNTLLLSGVFTNFKGGIPANQVTLKISVSHDVPPEHVKETLLKCLEGNPGVIHAPAPLACVQEYGDSGIVYLLSFAIEDYTRRPQIQDAVATRLWHAFQKERIPISYPTRTIYLEGADNGKISPALKRAPVRKDL